MGRQPFGIALFIALLDVFFPFLIPNGVGVLERNCHGKTKHGKMRSWRGRNRISPCQRQPEGAATRGADLQRMTLRGITKAARQLCRAAAGDAKKNAPCGR